MVVRSFLGNQSGLEARIATLANKTDATAAAVNRWVFGTMQAITSPSVASRSPRTIETMRSATFAGIYLFGMGFLLHSQDVQYSSEKKIWLLTAGQTSYAMGVSPKGELQNLYWGAPLWRIEDLPAASERRDLSSFDPHEMLQNEEYPGWGGPRFYEPALKITRADGNRDLVLRYQSHHIGEHQLDVVLKDIRDNMDVTLHYRVFPQGVLARWSTIRNGTDQAVTVESAQSASWYLPPGSGYQLSYLSGRWAAETQLNHKPIHEGIKVLESRLGHTGHNLNPWFAVDRG